MWWDGENGVKVKIENAEKRAVVIFPQVGGAAHLVSVMPSASMEKNINQRKTI